MSIKVILFDLDGVLVDACEWHYRALNEALFTICGEKIEREEHIETFNGLPTNEKLEILFKQERIKRDQFQNIWNLKQLLTEDVIRKHAKTDVRKVQMLTKLVADGYKLGCVTNSIRLSAKLMLEKTSQINFLSTIITNEDVNEPKPDPAGYIKAMVQLNCYPSETLIVEDSPKGQLAAQASGAHLIKVKDASEVKLELLEEYINKFK